MGIHNRTGCWRCGKIDGEAYLDYDTDKFICAECGEAGIVTFQQALDIINNYYLIYGRIDTNDEEYDFET